MSYEVPQQRRPGSVTTAGYLLYLVALVIVIDGVIAVVISSKLADATRAAYQAANVPNINPDTVASFAQTFTIITAVVYVLLAVGLAVLASLDLRGKNPARIVTWVLAGIGVLCFCAGTIGGAASGTLGGLGSTSTNGVNTADVQKQIMDAMPSWYQPTNIILSVVNLLALILVIILLALPASNKYFRKAPVGPVSTGDPGYPQYGTPPGGQPPYPGQQPPPGNEPPYPGGPSA